VDVLVVGIELVVDDGVVVGGVDVVVVDGGVSQPCRTLRAAEAR
jgi:hypothetical protein